MCLHKSFMDCVVKGYKTIRNWELIKFSEWILWLFVPKCVYMWIWFQTYFFYNLVKTIQVEFLAYVCVFSCVWLCDPMDCRLPGSSVPRISQARIMEWVAIPFPRGSFRTKDWNLISRISCIGRQILYHWATWEAYNYLQ